MPSNSARVLEVFAGFVVLAVAVQAGGKCRLMQFAVEHTNGSTNCQDCPTCLPGKGLSHECGKKISAEDVKNVWCLDCVSGETYSTGNDTSQCSACYATCSKGQVILQNCSVTSDKKCDDKCDAKGLYHEESTRDCQPCSWCCGDQFDVVEKECTERGMSMKKSCSVHQKNRCQPKTTTVKHTPTTPWSRTMPSTPHHTTSPTTLATPVLNMTPTTSTTIIAKSTSENHNKTGGVIVKIVVITFAVVCAILLLLVVMKARRCCSRLRSGQKRDLQSRTEQGCEMAELSEMTSSVKHYIPQHATKYDYNINPTAKSDSLRQLLPSNNQAEGGFGECSNVGHASIEEGMTLTEFADKNYTAFEEVCQLLDIKRPGCGHYEHVAKHYGVPGYTIQSRFENHKEGASKAVFELLASKYPQLTLGEFFLVLKKIDRNDVVLKFISSN